jgi:hypothetical protein
LVAGIDCHLDPIDCAATATTTFAAATHTIPATSSSNNNNSNNSNNSNSNNTNSNNNSKFSTVMLLVCTPQMHALAAAGQPGKLSTQQLDALAEGQDEHTCEHELARHGFNALQRKLWWVRRHRQQTVLLRLSGVDAASCLPSTFFPLPSEGLVTVLDVRDHSQLDSQLFSLQHGLVPLLLGLNSHAAANNVTALRSAYNDAWSSYRAADPLSSHSILAATLMEMKARAESQIAVGAVKSKSNERSGSSSSNSVQLAKPSTSSSATATAVSSTTAKTVSLTTAKTVSSTTATAATTAALSTLTSTTASSSPSGITLEVQAWPMSFIVREEADTVIRRFLSATENTSYQSNLYSSSSQSSSNSSSDSHTSNNLSNSPASSVLVLVGEPGSGKSTLLRNASRQLWAEVFPYSIDPLVPVYIDLRTSSSVIGVVDRALGGKARADHLRTSGVRCAFIFDGCDEMLPPVNDPMGVSVGVSVGGGLAHGFTPGYSASGGRREAVEGFLEMLWQGNSLSQWSHGSKVVIATSRLLDLDSALTPSSSFGLFGVKNDKGGGSGDINGKGNNTTMQMAILAPLSHKQIVEGLVAATTPATPIPAAAAAAAAVGQAAAAAIA